MSGRNRSARSVHVARNRPRRKEFAWAAVSEAFALGSTFSMQLCRRFGLDPDTGADLKTPNVFSANSSKTLPKK